MKLTAFEIEQYRSISQTQRLKLSGLTVLVGPNNEGKSNTVRAIALALTLLEGMAHGREPRFRYRRPRRQSLDYEWARDYPVALQQSTPRGETRLLAQFELSSKDKRAFYEKFDTKLTKDLKVRLRLGVRRESLEVVIPGSAKKKLSERTPEIAEFITRRIGVSYIPAHRNSEAAVEVVDTMLRRRLLPLTRKPAYRSLVKKLEKLEKPVRDALAKELADSLQGFIPEIRDVDISRGEPNASYRARGGFRLVIDDGTPTDLNFKGDGIQSLAAISVLRHSTRQEMGNRNIVLVIEEPEAHLHPEAVHRLAPALRELAEEHQVLITTHSPILVDRSSASRNIIVSSGRAQIAKTTKQVRESLGVRVSDNLTTAELVVICEGTTDERVLRAWLRSDSSQLATALKGGRLVFDALEGASNLSYKSRLYRNLLCTVVAIVDDDKAGKQALQLALNDGVLDVANTFATKRQGYANAEFEDLIQPSLYNQGFIDEFGLDLLSTSEFKKRKQLAWSERVKLCFDVSGLTLTKQAEGQAKRIVADAAIDAGSAALFAACTGVYETFKKRLEELLER